MWGVPPRRRFFCAVPPPHFFSSILDSKQSINLAQLVSTSVALPAELVEEIIESIHNININANTKLIIQQQQKVCLISCLFFFAQKKEMHMTSENIHL